MLIDRIELHHVAMPLITPWRTAYGEDSAVHALLCRLSSGSVDAWGESALFAAPTYKPEWGAGVFLLARDWLAPRLLGQEIASGAALQDRLSAFKGNPFAKAAFDIAWWHLRSKIEGRPLHALLGATRTEAPVGQDFGVGDDIDALLASVDGAVAEGYARIKLKFRPGWDLPMLRAVRARQPEHPIHIDCNSGYRLSDLALFREVDELGLAMIEQPLAHDDLVDHATLQSALRTPLCLDESIGHPDHARQAVALGSCGYINVKPARVGGLTNAVAIHDLCREAGMPCWVGGMLESATGASVCAALAMLDNFTYPADIFPSSRFYREDLAERPLTIDRDAAGVPVVRAPASIPEPDPGRLAALSLESAVLR